MAVMPNAFNFSASPFDCLSPEEQALVKNSVGVAAMLLLIVKAFEAAQIETNINRLTQDIEDDQAKLDQLVANLPDKASDMGMVPQQGSVSIDLSGYQSNKGGTQ